MASRATHLDSEAHQHGASLLAAPMLQPSSGLGNGGSTTAAAASPARAASVRFEFGGGGGGGFGGGGGAGLSGGRGAANSWGTAPIVEELTSAEQAAACRGGGLEASGFGCGSDATLQRLQRLQAWVATPPHGGSPAAPGSSPCGSLLALPALSQHVNLAQLGEGSPASTAPASAPAPAPAPAPASAPTPSPNPNPNPRSPKPKPQIYAAALPPNLARLPIPILHPSSNP